MKVDKICMNNKIEENKIEIVGFRYRIMFLTKLRVRPNSIGGLIQGITTLKTKIKFFLVLEFKAKGVI